MDLQGPIVVGNARKNVENMMQVVNQQTNQHTSWLTNTPTTICNGLIYIKCIATSTSLKQRDNLYLPSRSSKNLKPAPSWDYMYRLEIISLISPLMPLIAFNHIVSWMLLSQNHAVEGSNCLLPLGSLITGADRGAAAYCIWPMLSWAESQTQTAVSWLQELEQYKTNILQRNKQHSKIIGNYRTGF